MLTLSLIFYFLAVCCCLTAVYRLMSGLNQHPLRSGIKSFVYALGAFSMMGLTNLAVTYIFHSGFIKDTKYPENVLTMIYALYSIFASAYYTFMTCTCFELTGNKPARSLLVFLIFFQSAIIGLSVLQIEFGILPPMLERLITIRKLDLYMRIYLGLILIIMLLRSRRLTERVPRRGAAVFALVFLLFEAGNFLHHDIFPGWYTGVNRALSNSLSFFVPAAVIVAGAVPFFRTFFGSSPEPACFSCVDLNDREKRIINMICEGLSNKEIAYEQQLSLSNVKYYSHRIYKKLGVANRVELCNLVRSGFPST